nr:HAD hydrolase-like protein [Gemmatimonadota bacterium]
QRAGVEHDTITARLPDALSRYLDLLHHELSTIDPAQHVFPGIDPLLDALEQRDDVLLGLLTGNIQPGAVAKLRAVGINPDRFKVGAFGSDHASRPELPGIARSRAEALLGHAVAGDDVIVIGDTPADMSCGNGIGARAIGVATGRYSVAQLNACAEGVVFQDLSDTDAVLSAILGAADA